MLALRFGILIGLWCGLHGGSLAAAPLTNLEVGLASAYKLGYWTRVSLQAANDAPAGTLRLWVPDDEGTTSSYQQTVIPGQPVTAYVRFGRQAASIDASFGLEIGATRIPLGQIPPPLGALQQLVLVLGEDDAGFVAGTRLRPQDPGESIVATTMPDPAALPTEWYAYDAVDVLVITTGATQYVEAIQPAQQAAIDDFVKLGGRLILSIGRHADSLITPDSWLAKLLPGEFQGVINQRETSALEGFAESNQRLDLLAKAGLPMVRLSGVSGEQTLTEGFGQDPRPWVIRHAYGLGLVTLVATDLDIGAVAEWKGRPRLVARLLDETLSGRNDTASQEDMGRVSHLGFADLSGQLNDAMQQFASVRLVPFSVIALIATVYILLIGPGDYFFLNGVIRRMSGTWITLPLLVVGVAAISLLIAQRFKGSSFQLNQVDILDVDVHSGTFRASSWYHVFTPRTGQLDVTAVPRAVGHLACEQRGVLLGWEGQPGNGFGGLASESSPAASLYEPFASVNDGTRLTPDVRIQHITVPIWSSRRFHSVAWGSCPAAPAVRIAVDENGLLQGELQNPLDVPLQDAGVYYGRWFYGIGRFDPAGTFNFDGQAPRDLSSRLTRRKIVDAKQIVTPWRRDSLDIARIIEMLMFHEAAGGRAYTDLLH